MTQSIPGQGSVHVRRRPKPYVPVSDDKFKSDREATTRAERKSVPKHKASKQNPEKKESKDGSPESEKQTTSSRRKLNPCGTKFTNKSTRDQDYQQQESVASPRCSWSDEKSHEICIGHLRGKCKYGDGCKRLHGKLPFQWQYRSYTGWKNVSDEENNHMEKLFSAPANTGFSASSWFQDVLCMNSMVIRRLSTRSTVTCNSSYLAPYCIEWQWFWQEELYGYSCWKQYAQKNSKDGMQTHVNGNDLEEAYNDYLSGGDPSIFPFKTQKNQYHLNFVTMIQKNLVYQTERAVERRPKFVTMAERRQLAGQLQQQEKILGTKNVPKTWNVRGMLLDEPKLIPLDIGRHGDEYMKVADMFWNTMDDKNGTIFAIKRVQNVELWEDFSIKKDRMSKKIKGSVDERQLWHGTGKKSSEAIWRQNFDFRISGSNVGTLYGQGSYFASNANYSDQYSKPEGHIRRMFLVRVLVGSFVKGVQAYKRPPLKDPNDPSRDLHDSCVDNELNPSIYVVFDKSQVYPEYLIEYKRLSDQGSPKQMHTHSMPNHSPTRASSYSSTISSANTARVSTLAASPSNYPYGASSSSPASRQSTSSNYTSNATQVTQSSGTASASAYPSYYSASSTGYSETNTNTLPPFWGDFDLTQYSDSSSPNSSPNASPSRSWTKISSDQDFRTKMPSHSVPNTSSHSSTTPSANTAGVSTSAATPSNYPYGASSSSPASRQSTSSNYTSNATQGTQSSGTASASAYPSYVSTSSTGYSKTITNTLPSYPYGASSSSHASRQSTSSNYTSNATQVTQTSGAASASAYPNYSSASSTGYSVTNTNTLPASSWSAYDPHLTQVSDSSSTNSSPNASPSQSSTKRSSDQGSHTKMPTHMVPKASSYSSTTSLDNAARVNTSAATPSNYPYRASSSSTTSANTARVSTSAATPSSSPYSALPNTSQSRSSTKSTPSAATSLLRFPSSGFGMGLATPSAPSWSDDNDNSSYSGRRAASKGVRPSKSSNKSSCCIQ